MPAKFNSNKSFESAKGSSNDKAPRVEELVDVLKFPPNDWVQLRFVGPLIPYGNHWVVTKKLDGSLTKFPTPCLSFDPDTEEHDSTKECPWCDAESDKIQTGKEYYINAIIRQIQEDKPDREKPLTASEKKTGIKEKGSKSWTPVRVVRLTGSVVREIKKIASLNRHKDKKTGEKKSFPLTHTRYGMDVSIMFDPNEKTPSKKYTIQKSDASPLSEEESEYLLYQIEGMIKTPSLKTAKTDFDRWADRNLNAGKKKKKDEDDDVDEDDDDEEEEVSSKKSKGKPAAKGKKKPVVDEDDDEDDEDDLDEDDDDEDEDEAPKKKKPAAKGKKKVVDEDEDEDDEEPAKKKKPVAKKASSKKPAAKGKKKPVDEDEEDEDDEDEEEDDLDDDEEDEEDDDAPPAKKGKATASKKKAPAKGKKKPVDEDEDDLDDDEDDLDEDEDEEEDEPPPKKKKVVAKKAPAKGKKKRPVDDDDEDEDD